MSTAAAFPWLRSAYQLAIVLHAIFLVIAVGIVGYAALEESGANAARPGGWLAAIIMATTLSPAIPSAFALVSWNICRKRGWNPTAGHMGLVVAAAGIILIFMLIGAVA